MQTIHEQAIQSVTPPQPDYIKKILSCLEQDTKTDSTVEMSMGVVIECLPKPIEGGFDQSYKFSINYDFNRQGLRPDAHAEAKQMEDYLTEARARSVRVSQVVDGMFQVHFFKGEELHTDPAISAYPLDGERRGKSWLEIAASNVYCFLLTGTIY